MLQLSVWGVSTTLQTSNSMFGGIYSLVRLIFAAEEQLFTLVLFPPLQVCYTLFSTLKYSLISSSAVPLGPSDTMVPFESHYNIYLVGKGAVFIDHIMVIKGKKVKVKKTLRIVHLWECYKDILVCRL
jgi:hypothetical protein